MKLTEPIRRGTTKETAQAPNPFWSVFRRENHYNPTSPQGVIIPGDVMSVPVEGISIAVPSFVGVNHALQAEHAEGVRLDRIERALEEQATRIQRLEHSLVLEQIRHDRLVARLRELDPDLRELQD